MLKYAAFVDAFAYVIPYVVSRCRLSQDTGMKMCNVIDPWNIVAVKCALRSREVFDLNTYDRQWYVDNSIQTRLDFA